MFIHSCTVYNKWFNPSTRRDEWRRTVLTGVFFDNTRGVNFNKTGSSSADKARVLIPFAANAGSKTYKDPIAWATFPDYSWTLQSGDRIIKGQVTYEVIFKPSELDERYNDVLTVTGVDKKDFGGGMAHWEVGAK
jgi:hypothetical protein